MDFKFQLRIICWAWTIVPVIRFTLFKAGNLIGGLFVMSNGNLGLGMKRLYWYLIIGCIISFRCFIVSYIVDV